MKSFLLLGVLLLVSCSEAPERMTRVTYNSTVGSEGNSNAEDERKGAREIIKPADGVKTIRYTLKPVQDADAYDTTFGIVELSFESGKALTDLRATRGIIVKKGYQFTTEESLLADRVCKDIELSRSPNTVDPLLETRADESIYLLWRSHYSAAIKTMLADIAMKTGSSPRCLLTLSGKAANQPYKAHIIFETILSESSEIVGTMQLKAAVREGISLPLVQGEWDATRYDALTIDAAANIFFNIPALHRETIQVEFSEDPTNKKCVLEPGPTAGSTKLATPELVSNFSHKITSTVGMKIGEVKRIPVAGRDIQECKKVATEIIMNKVKISFSCETYLAIKEQGLESGCSWQIPVKNSSDDENSAWITLVMGKLAFETKTTMDPPTGTGTSNLPRSSMNPVRDGSLKLQGYSEVQATMMEDALDLWAAVDPASFNADFYRKVKSLYMDTDKNNCSGGTIAYAYLNSSAIYWCSSAIDRNFPKGNRFDPTNLIYLAGTLAHEARHTSGWNHDVDDKSYAPCQGAAASAILPVALINNCNFDLCKLLKGVAVPAYRAELDYDYSGDRTGRKSQGLCKTWSTVLGVTGNGY